MNKQRWNCTGSFLLISTKQQQQPPLHIITMFNYANLESFLSLFSWWQLLPKIMLSSSTSLSESLSSSISYSPSSSARPVCRCDRRLPWPAPTCRDSWRQMTPDRRCPAESLGQRSTGQSSSAPCLRCCLCRMKLTGWWNRHHLQSRGKQRWIFTRETTANKQTNKQTNKLYKGLLKQLTPGLNKAPMLALTDKVSLMSYFFKKAMASIVQFFIARESSKIIAFSWPNLFFFFFFWKKRKNSAIISLTQLTLRLLPASWRVPQNHHSVHDTLNQLRWFAVGTNLGHVLLVQCLKRLSEERKVITGDHQLTQQCNHTCTCTTHKQSKEWAYYVDAAHAGSSTCLTVCGNDHTYFHGCFQCRQRSIQIALCVLSKLLTSFLFFSALLAASSDVLGREKLNE